MRTKRLIWTAIALLMATTAIPALTAAEPRVETDIDYIISTGDHVLNGYGATVRIYPNEWLFGYLSASARDIQWGGQKLAGVNLYSIGAGIEHRWDWVSVFGQIGYYQPDLSGTDTGSSHEAQEYLMREKLPGISYRKDGYHNPYNWGRSFDMEGAVGAMIGTKVEHEIFENFRINAGISYLWLNLEYDCVWSDPDYVRDYAGYWIVTDKMDMGGIVANVGVVFVW